jgi:hypothetical protein
VPTDNPADIDNHKYIITQTDDYGVNVCGVGNNTRTYASTTIYGGTAGPGDSPCVNGTPLGWHSANPTIFTDTLTTNETLTIEYGNINCAGCSYQIGGIGDYDNLVNLIISIQNSQLCGTSVY